MVNFGLFDLVGKALTPRIRGPGKITMLRMAGRSSSERRPRL